ncbi:unnamed protein product [Caretta caretta]
MSQQCLDSLVILYIEQELASSVNYNDVIEEFKSITPARRLARAAGRGAEPPSRATQRPGARRSQVPC